MILIDLINSFFIKNHGINQNFFHLLESYPNKKILTTNATEEYLEELGIGDMPYEVFSLQRNPAKTEKAYFEMLAERYQLDLNDCLLIDRKEEVIKIAAACGMKTCMYQVGDGLSGLREMLDMIIDQD